MTQIFSDVAGYTYLGDCIYANHNVGYANVDFLKACPHTEIGQALATFGSSAFGSQLFYTAPQSMFNDFAMSAPQMLISWSPVGDTTPRRYGLTYRENGVDASESAYAGGFQCALFNNTGYSGSFISLNQNNILLNLIWSSRQSLPAIGLAHNLQGGFVPEDTLRTDPTWVISSDSNYICYFRYQKSFTSFRNRCIFFYQGQLDNVNTGFNYYSADVTTRSFMMFGLNNLSVGTDSQYANNGSPFEMIVGGAHRIANQNKYTLQTGDAQYPINCDDGQTPTDTWATDFYVFDNNSTIGFPAIGKVRGLLLGTGTYTIGKPVKLTGTVVPDGGSRHYLPIGNYAGKTVLMKCYSSVNN